MVPLTVQKRSLAAAGLFLLFGAFLAGRLFWVQGVRGGDLAQEAFRQRSQVVPLEVPRGAIYDRDGRPLTGAGFRLNVVVFPSMVKDKAAAARKIGAALGLPPGAVLEDLRREAPVVLKRDAGASVVEALGEAGVPGVLVTREKLRYGPDSLANHLVGYIDGPSNQGKDGLEKQYDQYLRGGRAEAVAAFFDGRGSMIPGLGFRKFETGASGKTPGEVYTTIDRRWQAIVEDVMDRGVTRGAVVVIDVRNGEVLAMASRPDFRRMTATGASSRRPASGQESASSEGAWLNRAVSAYQPGSVFKMVVAAAALEERLVTSESQAFCRGFIDVGDRRFNCNKSEGHGLISFRQAFAYSSNPVFIETGLRLGTEKILRYARKLGLGEVTALSLPGESPGSLPLGRKLLDGDVANLSIGQGPVTVTPLQMAQLIAIVADDGVARSLTLVREIRTREGEVLARPRPGPARRAISAQTARELQKAMADVPVYGTGRAAAVPTAGAAGKTGSAEVEGPNGERLTHAWFAGYAPVRRPAVAVVVFVEEGESGGTTAAPVFREIVRRGLGILP